MEYNILYGYSNTIGKNIGMFDLQIVEDIRNARIADMQDPVRRGDRKKAPDSEVLKILIEESFLASLKSEEGIYNNISITYLPLATGDLTELESYIDQLDIMKFQQVLEFNSESLKKLSSSCNPDNNSLVVINDNSGDLCIVGMVFFHSPTNWLNGIPFAFAGFSKPRPDYLMINCYAPGSFNVCRGSKRLGRFVHGEFMISRPDPFYSKAMGNYILDALSKNRNSKVLEESSFYKNTISVLLKEISSRTRGASLIFIPNDTEKYTRAINIKYRIKDTLKIMYLKELMFSKLYNNTDMTNIGMKRFLHERLKFIANIARSDGALILTSDFEVVGFGATLVSPTWNGDVIIGPDGFGHEGEIFHIQKYGTRHNSMVNYIGENDDCFGFVFSYDGPIRGFYKIDKNTVYCWPDCSVSIFEF